MSSFKERHDSFLWNLRSDATPPTCKLGFKLCGVRCVPQEDKCKDEKQASATGKRKMSRGEKAVQAVNAFSAVSNIENTVRNKDLSGSQKAVGVAKKAALHSGIAIAANRTARMNEDRKAKEAKALPGKRGNPTKSANVK
jgi:hypothetical protein